MKERISKILSVFLALVVLISTTSFTVDMHYCGDYLVDTGVFSKAESCGMEDDGVSSNSTSEIKKNCCNNEQFIVDGQEELRVDTTNLTIEKQQLFAIVFKVSYLNLFEDLNKSLIPYKEYSPPILIENTRILNQVFRI